jgi:triosephosphate isomerase
MQTVQAKNTKQHLIVANWKMHPPTLADAKRLFEITKRAVSAARSYQVVVAPPAVFLRDIAKGYRGKRILCAAQNMHWEESGPYTGEISPGQVKDAGASYVLVGHTERRVRGETNEDTARKMAAAAAHKLMPILCIGEAQRNPDGEYWNVLSRQLLIGMCEMPKASLKDVIIAYEPVWAVGAPNPMEPEDMHGTAIFIRKTLVQAYGRPGLEIPILYGGAIDEASAAPMLLEGDVEGLLVGRVSTDGRRFARLLEAVRASSARM